MALPPECDPDAQPPLPLPAAEGYAREAWRRAAAVDAGGLVVTRGMPYGAHRLQRYDVYAPRGARNRPVLVFWHGGGWTNGYREWVAFMAPHVCALGLVFVAPSYRLVPEVRLDGVVADALSALAHVVAQAGGFGGDATRLLLSGHSAGGHLAALAALRGTRQDAGLAACVRACLPVSAILDLHHPAPPPDSLEERVYTMTLGDPLDDARLSPVAWCAGNRVPFVLSVGERDTGRVLLSNRRAQALLELQEGASTLQVWEGADHFATHLALDSAAHPWYRALQALAER